MESSKLNSRSCARASTTRTVIELAQLRQKLPRDALSILSGLSDLKTAWARLDESYGNTNMQVLAALKRLRSFKTSKTAAHDQVVEMATAVQRCVTVLTALSRLEDFLRDQETLAEVSSVLPADSQQRWYHRKGARDESPREKGSNFLAWLEEERADAVAIHLDTLAKTTQARGQPASGEEAGRQCWRNGPARLHSCLKQSARRRRTPRPH